MCIDQTPLGEPKSSVRWAAREHGRDLRRLSSQKLDRD